MFRRVSAVLLLLSFALPAPALPPATAPKVAKAANKPTKKTPKPRTISTKELAKRVDKYLTDPAIQRGFWGIHVIDAATGKTLYEQNADRLFTPASNTKLFTTVTAMATLGPNYKAETSIETNGVLEPTRQLKGDLILVGRGDPNISGRVIPYHLKTERVPPHLRPLEQLADTLVGAGLKQVEGDVIGDDSLFAFERYGEGWGQDDLMWSDGAPASALTVNDNTIFLTIAPGNVGEPAKITVDPDVQYYEIVNKVTTIAVGTGKRDIGINREPGSRTLSIWGSIPADDQGLGEGLAIDDPAEYAAIAFRDMLVKRGVTITGKERAQHKLTSELPIYALDVDKASQAQQHEQHGGSTETAPAVSTTPRTVLAKLESRPFSDDLVVINKISQNLHAEIALRAAGHARGAPASLEGALAAEQHFLESIGISKDEFRFYDGSGMSAHNVVSPRAITKLLQWTANQPWGDQFRASLPVAGLDGSLDDRFRSSVANGRIWAKTGTLTHVNALSGYAETESGRKLIFAVLVNNHRLTSSGAKKVIDHVLELLIDDQTGR
ncbi:MAG TPA: D-alanyl-D-alanine carboxypeptidase/D-alanyl-D-alanine-endopeptidase [Terriglobales bacterium]|nr:D-alanyl-D-alanine carboxypeptidase/D-alanyl-D-alanine-endopeptidase [Terriglobales bacterium]